MLMATAIFRCIEDALTECHHCLLVLRFEGNVDERLQSGSAVLLIPGEGECKSLTRHDVPVDTAVPELFAARGGVEAGAPFTANPQVCFDIVAG